MKLASTLMASAIVLSAGAASAADLTIVSWGGAYSASQNNAYHKPFMEMRKDVNIINDESSNEAVAKLRAMSEAGNVTWDVVDVEGPDSQRLCDEGLAMEIDFDEWLAAAPDGSPATKDFGPSLINKCFIPQIVFSTTFGYRTDVAAWNGKVPTSLCDIFDTENFPGKRSLEKRPKKNLEWALLCDGVAKEDLYTVLSTPEGLQKALAKLDTIKKDVIWWSAGAETPQRLADGEAVFGSTYNGRLFSVIEEQKQPVAMLWDWQVFDFDGWIIPADVPEDKLPLIKEYIKFATDTQRLADQAKYISYGPARASSQPLVGKHEELGIEMAPHMPTNPENQKNYLVNNIEWWADNQDEVEAAFQVWLTK
ncbi:extracellular solute-binding protein [Pannonibacter phragmitetus]|uniref:extracellular solute-binding protein n=1 Tax=Pannonibacter phragmitetus TaxID=121719 RepID=UPI003D2F2F78